MLRSAAFCATQLAFGCSLLFTAPDRDENCPPRDQHTVALYDFEGVAGELTIPDVVGANDAMSLQVEVRTTAGPPGCGDALLVPAGSSPVVIDHSEDWELSAGSLDLWLLLNDDPAEAGILTRDASGTEKSGHFLLKIEPSSGRVYVRLQGLEPEDDGVACSEEPIRLGAWVHLAVNFGPPELELFVDGRLQHGEGEIRIAGAPSSCQRPTELGIDGNENPWVLGASTVASDEGSHEPLRAPLRNAAIDHVRISSERRDFVPR